MGNTSIDVSAAIDFDNIGNYSVQSDRLPRIAAIDGHALVLQGLETLLSAEPDFELVDCYQTVPELLADVGIDGRLDVAVLDLWLTDNPDPAQNVLSLELVTDHALVLSSIESPCPIRKAVRIGVMGVVQESETPETVVSIVQLAALDKGALATGWAPAVDSDPLLDPVDLSERQREVLELCASGESTKQVASITGLTPNTALGYLGRIRARYTVAGRAENSPNKSEMYRLAQQDGYLPGPMNPS